MLRVFSLLCERCATTRATVPTVRDHRHDRAHMLSVLLMFRRLTKAIGYAAKEEGFLAVLGAGILTFAGPPGFPIAAGVLTVVQDVRDSRCDSAGPVDV